MNQRRNLKTLDVSWMGSSIVTTYRGDRVDENAIEGLAVLESRGERNQKGELGH